MRTRYFILLFIFHFSFFVHSHAQIISTIAGNGVQGFYGDGGAATSAEFYFPSGLVCDDTGNVYIADSWNARIRKFSVSSGIITTIAGNGANTLTIHSGSPATSTPLGWTFCLVMDSHFNIYFSEKGNAVQEIIDSTGILITVAGNGYTGEWYHQGGYSGDGGPATAAEMYGPTGVALDDSNNIYIADGGNSVIRKVTASTGIINTIAGIGEVSGYSGNDGPATAAELYEPQGICIDDSGNLYIADENEVIREVVLSSGIISTVAGSGIAGYSGDGGVATAAEFLSPADVRFDTFHNMYISDGSNRIRMVSANTGIISTIAGDETAGYSGDGGLATNAELNGPGGMAFDGVGNLYFADEVNNRIREVTYDASTGMNELITKSEDVRVFPNPNNGIFNLYLSNISNKCNIEVFNYLGENIYTAKINSGNTEINLGGQPNGVYLYRVLKVSGELVGEGKVIIEK
jgi:trimeric autotransporter adhesin